MAAKVIRPGVLILVKMVGTARKAATDLTAEVGSSPRSVDTGCHAASSTLSVVRCS